MSASALVLEDWRKGRGGEERSRWKREERSGTNLPYVIGYFRRESDKIKAKKTGRAHGKVLDEGIRMG